MDSSNPQIPSPDTMIEQNAMSAMAQQIPAQMYNQEPKLFTVMEQILSDNAIPLSLRNQFYIFWSNIQFGNYTEFDIKKLYLRFQEWCIFLMWYIPDFKWNQEFVYAGDPSTSSLSNEYKTDLPMLINMLDIVFYSNLTKGRGGFLTKEMNSSRFNWIKNGEDGNLGAQTKKFSLF